MPLYFIDIFRLFVEFFGQNLMLLVVMKFELFLCRIPFEAYMTLHGRGNTLMSVLPVFVVNPLTSEGS